jgi:hypothetical protein
MASSATTAPPGSKNLHQRHSSAGHVSSQSAPNITPSQHALSSIEQTFETFFAAGHAPEDPAALQHYLQGLVAKMYDQWSRQRAQPPPESS